MEQRKIREMCSCLFLPVKIRAAAFCTSRYGGGSTNPHIQCNYSNPVSGDKGLLFQIAALEELALF